MAYVAQLLQRKILFSLACSAAKSAAVYRIVYHFRQTDTEFISVLNNLRDNKITANDVAALNKYVQPDFDLKPTRDTLHLLRITIKDAMNAQALADLKGELITYSQKLWVIFQNISLSRKV
jgi:hypothetical protein